MTTAKPCDHKFMDSRKCLKCGWSPDQNKADLVNAIANLPEEAFGWLVLTLCDLPLQTARGQVWPDGLGGFSNESRTGIEAVRTAARVFAGIEPRPTPRTRNIRMPKMVAKTTTPKGED